MAKAPPVDKRRQILDAAIRVFARQGFHATRVSDIADEAGVAYGLVYHYFKSKDEVLNELFIERWSLLLAAIEEADRPAPSPRDKLGAVAGFIVDSYRHDPELMKVIIVEVTRAANSFGRTHLPEIRRAYESIAKIVADGQASGAFRRDIDPIFASMSFYGAIEQLLSGWIFDVIPASDTDFDQARTLVDDDLRRPRAAIGKPTRRERRMDNEIVKRLVWSGLLAASGALASIVAARRRGDRLPPPLRRGPAGVGAPMPEPTARPHRRSRRRDAPEPQDRSVAELVFDVSESASAGPRGDRARQGRGLRESRQAPARLGRRHRRRRLRLPGADPDHAGGRLAARRRALRRQHLARLLRRGGALPADRRRRRLLRLPLGPGRRAAGARAGDRRGEADQGDARRKEAILGERETSR